MDDTITPDETTDQGSAELQPDVQSYEGAENVQEVTQDQPESTTDDEAIQYLASKGIDPSSPEALSKVASMYRDAEKLISRQGMEKSELRRKVDETNSQAIDNYEGVDTSANRLALLEFQVQNRDYEPGSDLDLAMGKIMEEADLPTRLYFSQNLDLVKKMAKAELYESQVASARDEGRKEERQALASRQRASAPTAAAVTQGSDSQAITPQNVDEMVGKMSLAEYNRRKPEIDAALGR